MPRRIVAIVAALAAFVAASTFVVSAIQASAADPGADEARFVVLINDARARAGVGPLSVDPVLTNAARQWSTTMAANGAISHAASIASGVGNTWLKLGENVGVGPNPDVLMQAFIASPAHYANIVDPAFDHIGVGVVWSGSALFVTQRFQQSMVPNRSAPLGSLDAVVPVRANAVRVAGWTFDPDSSAPIAAHVYVDGAFNAALVANTSRLDVAAAFGIDASHGFDNTINVGGGTHSVCAYGIDSGGGTNPLLGCRSVTMPADNLPVGSLDIAAIDAPGGARVAGWAFDRDVAPAPIAVHVYVDGGFAASLSASRPRGDVNAALGVPGDHGFDDRVSVAPGAHTLCVYAINDNLVANVALGCRVVVG